jgi:hypothetical protein
LVVGVLLAIAPAAGAGAVPAQGDPSATSVPPTTPTDPAATVAPSAPAPETTTDVDLDAPVAEAGDGLTDSERATRLLRWVTIALVGLAVAIVLISVVFWRRTDPKRLMAQDAARAGTAPARSIRSASERPGWSTTPVAAAAQPKQPVTSPVADAPAGAPARVPAAAAAVAATRASDPWAAPAPGEAVAPAIPVSPGHTEHPAVPPRPLVAPAATPPTAAHATRSAPTARPARTAPARSSSTGQVEPGHSHGLWASSGWDDPVEGQPESPPGGGGGHTAPAANPFDPHR